MPSDVPTPVPQSPVQPAEVHLHDYLRVILRRRTTFLAAFLAVFLGVAIYTYTVKPVYEAFATLHVRDEKGKGDLLGELGMSRQNPIDAEIEILKSRTNAEQVVKRLHLDWQVSRKSKGLDFKLLEFACTPPATTTCQVEVTGPDSFAVKDAEGKTLGTGRSGVLMQSGGISLLIGDLRGKPGDGFRLSLLPLHATAAGLKGAIRATEVGNKTSIIRLSYSDTDPERAQEVVNTLAQVYLEQSVAFKTQEASKSLGFIEEQMKSVRGDLDNAEKNLQVYKTSSGVVKLDSGAEELVKKISETERARTGLTLQRKQAEFALAGLRDAMKRGKVFSLAPAKDDQGISTLAGRLADLEVQKQSLLTDNTESHPAVRTLQRQIDELQKKILGIYETSQKNLARQETNISQQLAHYEGELRKLPEAERALATLMRHTKVNADIYTFLLQKHEEARIAKASTISNINVVDPAIAPDRPIKPNKRKNLLLGLLVGAMLGVGLAFFMEYLDDTIKDADEAKRAVGLPLLAVIPFIAGRESEEEGIALITRLEPKSSVAEAFRSLRTSLHFSAINRDKKILLLTSTFPGEGKSTISANLANTLSQTGARVLIIDCDLRRSSLHEKFGHSKVPGLAELLTGDAAFAVARHNSGIPGVDLVSAGTTPPNPAELLGSEAMRRFLATHRESYDHIVIDAPPVLAVTDAPVLTAMSDMVLVVMEAGRVPLKAAQRMREMLATIQAPVAGLVVNDKSGRGESYGYYGGRYYRYGYGYGYGYGNYYGEEPASRKKVPWWRKFFPKGKS